MRGASGQGFPLQDCPGSGTPTLLITGWEQPGLSGPLNVVVECEIAMDRSCQVSTFLEARFFLKGDMSGALLRLSAVLGILSLAYSRCHTI